MVGVSRDDGGEVEHPGLVRSGALRFEQPGREVVVNPSIAEEDYLLEWISPGSRSKVYWPSAGGRSSCTPGWQ